MFKKIFRASFLLTSLVLFFAVLLSTIVLSIDFDHTEMSALASQADLAASGVNTSGKKYLKNLKGENYRITWINSKGKVLYDNEENPKKMGNHARREEVAEAMKKGTGTSERYSTTLSTVTMYYAERLNNGGVIRIAITRNSFWRMLLRLLSPLLLIMLLAVLVSWFLAKPLNEMDLDKPLESKAYDEIKPLLTRLDSQNKQIADQMEQLHHREKELKTVTDAMQEGLILIDLDDWILLSNPAVVSLLGLHDTDPLPDDVKEIIDKNSRLAHTEGIVERNGRNIQISASPIISRKILKGTSILVVDVTEEYHEEQVRREFTANVSHELKTPLQSIMGSAELLENHLVKDEDRDGFYKKIHESSAQLLTLIDDIIRLSHLDENQRFEEIKLNLKSPVTEALEALQGSAYRHGIKLETNLSDTMILANFRLVYEIAYNLIDNSIRYNKEKGKTKITVKEHRGQAILQVADTGIGIPQEAQNRIFERFYRVEKSHSRKTGGTGLGLSIVKHAVQQCHGTIRLESELGKGSTFTVIFPALPVGADGTNK
ncbi:sensor histidine kinase [Lactobacillus crispatus]|uniref:sensor histidine kinase n=1 Tax=Lactobacillus crispatus TaxID=47770 RepID=UPI0001BAE4AC|nr:ATP-binding protein [Lactobacillus crispatus]EEX30012.1 ATPase/histidine kinase/DNA gyrase B/HSP90 domain protein [Lactobacillus crispatus MV-3A-US]MBI1713044.1 ATPase [Lactobacillus crispatus]MCZ3570731.1 ATP-binding protein [Lactobacillus crispatus]MCZ3576733.1 ATP-binding protein [Lactobacillus crispatus]MCZ3596096.1 ATP-binding protein [Lactobacillus crispatus]